MQAKLKKMLTWVSVSKESLSFIRNQWRQVGKIIALVCFPEVTSRTLFSIMWEAWKHSHGPECVLRCVASQHPTISHVAEDQKDDPLSISYLGYASVLGGAFSFFADMESQVPQVISKRSPH